MRPIVGCAKRGLWANSCLKLPNRAFRNSATRTTSVTDDESVLLKDPAILILDEATASVDPFTEAQIQEGLATLMRDRTAIVIAHRLSTVKHADRIVVMDHGCIIEEGTHAGLLARGGHYAELYNSYFRHQSLDYVEGLQSLMRTRA